MILIKFALALLTLLTASLAVPEYRSITPNC